MNRRILLFMICCLIGSWSAKAAFETDGGIQWKVDGNTLTIQKANEGDGVMKNYTTGKDCPWYPYSGDITSVIIEEGVTSVGEYAFYSHYTQLTSVKLPKGLTSIGANAFESCTNLSEINLPDELTQIGVRAFSSCAITSITIPDGVETLLDRTFYACDKLKSVSFGKRLKKIAMEAFQYCTALLSIEFTEGISIIDRQAFDGCTALETITFPNPKTQIFIRSKAFQNCSSLKEVTALSPDLQLNPIGGYSDTFALINTKNVILYVPAGSEYLYSAYEPWKYFQVKPITTPTPTYHTLTLDVADGIDLYNFAAGNHQIEEGGHLHLQFLPEDRTLTAKDILFLVDGIETEFTVFGGSNYFSYILNPVEGDHTILVALREYTVTLPETEGIIYNVGAGSHRVPYGEKFSFSLTLADDIDPAGVQVFANGIEIQPDALRATSLTYTIDKVITSIEISFEGVNPTSNASLTHGVRLSMDNGQLTIDNETANAVDVSVYTVTGQNVVQLRALRDSKTITLLPGIYLVKAGREVYKVSVH